MNRSPAGSQTFIKPKVLAVYWSEAFRCVNIMTKRERHQSETTMIIYKPLPCSTHSRLDLALRDIIKKKNKNYPRE